MAAPDLVADLTRNAVDVLPAGELERKLALGRPLRVKLGIDVTAPHVHVGHAIPLQRMAAFQRAGHVGVLIVGDYTTRIGDPSGRSAERPIPPRNRRDQPRNVLERRAIGDTTPDARGADERRVAAGSTSPRSSLTRTITVARLLERDDFGEGSRRTAISSPSSLSILRLRLVATRRRRAGGPDHSKPSSPARGDAEATSRGQVGLTTPCSSPRRAQEERVARKLHRATDPPEQPSSARRGDL